MNIERYKAVLKNSNRGRFGIHHEYEMLQLFTWLSYELWSKQWDHKFDEPYRHPDCVRHSRVKYPFSNEISGMLQPCMEVLIRKHHSQETIWGMKIQCSDKYPESVEVAIYSSHEQDLREIIKEIPRYVRESGQNLSLMPIEISEKKDKEKPSK